MKNTTTFIILFTAINVFSQDLPCKSYYKQSEGGRCKERYREDANGERHGLFILYDQNGAVQMRGNMVHGKPEGNWLNDGEYSFYVKNDCITYQTFGVDIKTGKWDVWYPTCVTSPTPIKSIEEAKAIGAKLYKAEKLEVDAKSKRQNEKKQSEIDKENARLDDIQKNMETSRTIAVNNEFYNSNTLEDFERFVSTNSTSPLVPQAKEKIAEFIRSEYASVMSLKNAMYANDINELITRGEAFLNNAKHNSFLHLKDNRQKLVNLINEAKTKLPNQVYSTCIEASYKDACTQFLSLNTNDADKIDKVKNKLIEIEAKEAIELKKRRFDERIESFRSGLFIGELDKKISKETTIEYGKNEKEKAIVCNNIMSEMILKFGDFPTGCNFEKMLRGLTFTVLEYKITNLHPDKIVFKKLNFREDLDVLILTYKDGKLVKFAYENYDTSYPRQWFTQKWDENGNLKD